MEYFQLNNFTKQSIQLKKSKNSREIRKFHSKEAKQLKRNLSWIIEVETITPSVKRELRPVWGWLTYYPSDVFGQTVKSFYALYTQRHRQKRSGLPSIFSKIHARLLRLSKIRKINFVFFYDHRKMLLEVGVETSRFTPLKLNLAHCSLEILLTASVTFRINIIHCIFQFSDHNLIVLLMVIWINECIRMQLYEVVIS